MNDKGYTLVELLVSMVITAIVLTIVISFLVTNSKSYTYASEEVNLQMESQTVMNQLYEEIIESNWVELTDVNSNVKALAIYNSSDVSVVFLKLSERHLYLVENLTKSEAANLNSISYTSEGNLMATDVINITIYPTDLESLTEEKKLTLKLEFKNPSISYSTEQDIKFRNKLVKP